MRGDPATRHDQALTPQSRGFPDTPKISRELVCGTHEKSLEQHGPDHDGEQEPEWKKTLRGDKRPAIEPQGKRPGAHRDVCADVRPSELRTRTSVSEHRVLQARRHLTNYQNNPHSHSRHDGKIKE